MLFGFIRPSSLLPPVLLRLMLQRDVAPKQCLECGGAVRRSRRGFFERLLYSEAFRCESCGKRTKNSSIDLKYVRYVKCPGCHSVDLTILKKPDRVDRMQRGVLNTLHRLGGGKLYHCWFCRIQFYDVRRQFDVIRKLEGDLNSPETKSVSDVKLAS